MQLENLDKPKEVNYTIAHHNNLATTIALLILFLLVFLTIASYANSIQNKVDQLVLTNIQCLETRNGR